MAKEKINLREELRLYKFDFDLLQKIPCSKQENKKYPLIVIDNSRKILYNNPYLFRPGRARNKAALVGELAVPCTCNPLQQG